MGKKKVVGYILGGNAKKNFNHKQIPSRNTFLIDFEHSFKIISKSKGVNNTSNQEHSQYGEETLEEFFIWWSFRQKGFEPHDVRYFFHYTFAKNASQIIQEKEIDFRLTKAEEFLDKNEGISIFEPYYHACGKLYDSGKIDEDFFQLVRNISPEMLLPKSNTWILSFSKDGCSDFLKERYAANNTKIISIKADAFSDVEFDGSEINFMTIQVCYSFEDFTNLFTKLLSRLYRAYCNERGITDDLRGQIVCFLTKTLESYRYAYKDYSFNEEKEIRIFIQTFKPFYRLNLDSNTLLRYDKTHQLHLILSRDVYFSNEYNSLDWTNSEQMNRDIIAKESFQKISCGQ